MNELEDFLNKQEENKSNRSNKSDICDEFDMKEIERTILQIDKPLRFEKLFNSKLLDKDETELILD